MADQRKGIVIKAQSGFFTVQTNDGDQVVARVRGRLKQEQRDTDLIATGDRVTISIAADGSANVEAVAERERALTRLAPSAKGRGGQCVRHISGLYRGFYDETLVWQCADHP